MDTNSQKKLFTAYLAKYLTEQKKERIETVLAARTRFCTIILENIYQPHNISAAIRSAECFGLQDVHIIEHPAFARYSAHNSITRGASEWLTFNNYKKTEDSIAKLKDAGYTIVATTPHSALADKRPFYELHNLPLDKKVALLFGTERLGISNEAIAHADAFLGIPMYGFTESFNISVSVALCLYDLSTRLRAPSIPWQLTDAEKDELRYEWYKQCIKGSDAMERMFGGKEISSAE